MTTLTILVEVVMEGVVPDGTWSLAAAKAKLSEVVERAKSHGPQHLTKNGKDAAVVLSAADYRRLNDAAAKPDRSAYDVLLDPAIRGLLTNEEADAIFARDKDRGRPIDL